MARITIASLQHQLVAADLALRTEMETSRLRAERIAALEAELAAYQVAQRPSRTEAQPRIVTRTQRELPAHFVAAREAAIRMGRSVKVGAE